MIEALNWNYLRKIETTSSHEFNQLRQVMNDMAEAIKDRELRFDYAVQGTSDGIWDWELKTNKVLLEKFLGSNTKLDYDTLHPHF